jgi:hypothetical protein
MRLPEIDWSVLRGALLLFGVALVLTLGLVGGGQWFHDEMHARFQQEQRRFQTNTRRYLNVDEEERLIGTYMPRSRDLEQSGVVGEEHRLAWVETLRAVSAELRLPEMRYEVQPQKAYAAAPVPIATGGLRVYGSTMRVSLGLLHEDDLFRFLDALGSQSLGSFSVERCDLRRSGAGLQADPERANLDAACDLLWVTIRKPREDERG